MNKLKISIAMCTYNGARYIREQLDSIQSQTRLPDELIICDDNSSDQTNDLVQDFAQKAPFTVQLHPNKEQLGTSGNFEKAIGLCTGDIIFLADQDDIWVPKKIAVMEDFFSKNHDTGVVFTDADIIDENSKHLNYTLWKSLQFNSKLKNQISSNKAINLLLKRNVITGATMAFRSKYKQIIFPIPHEWIHDHWIALFIGIQSTISLINQPLIKYRVHSSQQTGISRKTTFQVIKLREDAPDLIYKDIVRYTKALDHLISSFPESKINKYRPLFENKLSHLKFRRTLLKSKLKGISIILKKLLTGEYQRYSSRASLSAFYDMYRLFLS